MPLLIESLENMLDWLRKFGCVNKVRSNDLIVGSLLGRQVSRVISGRK
jgi:hypothetical protein